MQFQPNTKQDRLASLQVSKPQQASSRTRGAALQMPASEVLCLYICPEVTKASLSVKVELTTCYWGAVCHVSQSRPAAQRHDMAAKTCQCGAVAALNAPVGKSQCRCKAPGRQPSLVDTRAAFPLLRPGAPQACVLAVVA